jgi:radical SAM superfamily enzyme YgiQ (UPF0313 family)
MVYPEVFDLARFNEKRKEFPPFGVMYLSAMMEQAGHVVQVFAISFETSAIDFRGFDAVGYSIPSSATFGITKKVRFASKYDEGALIMAGGVHANLYPLQTLDELEPDVVGIGECEQTILDILERGKNADFGNILGVAFKKNGEAVKTPPRRVDKDIDWLPLPSRHLLPRSDIVMSNRLSNTDIEMAHVMFTRGCPFPCRFCAVAQTKIQYRSGASARREIVHLMETYGIGGFAIVDDNFIVDKRKVHDVAESIQDLGVKWSALSRVDTIDKELLTAMASSGCIEIKFGMESGSQRILDAMQKNTTPEQILEAARLSYEAGIKAKFFIVHGYPGENMETTAETIALLDRAKRYVDRVSLFRFAPLPGTYVYNHPEEFGLRGTDRQADWDGNWDKYHIYHNAYHWWGTDDQFEELNRAHTEISNYIDETWPATFQPPQNV